MWVKRGHGKALDGARSSTQPWEQTGLLKLLDVSVFHPRCCDGHYNIP